MDVAFLYRERSTCLRRKVGAVLARDGRILSTGYGGAPAGIDHCSPLNCFPDKPCLRTIHAEANAVAWAARTGIQTEPCTIYTTASPCIECAKLLINAGIQRVVYAEEYRDTTPILLLEGVGIRVERLDPTPYTFGWGPRRYFADRRPDPDSPSDLPPVPKAG
jgi:dCMP deaminase